MNVPIYDAIKKYFSGNPVPFHMPGHKLGIGLPEEFLKDIVRMDLTEIPGTDNLHYPESVIAEAQEIAAEVFGSDHTFFLVNGSTCGIHAIIMSICEPGDKLIVSRDCHKSVINGLILAGAEPVYIKPQFDMDFGIPTVLLPSEVKQALENNPDAVGVLVTRPNYYGLCSDLEEIAEIVHSYGKVLAVDEAHGSHLRFDSRLPVSALDAGADICVQSAHKTLMAFTQGAYLHLKSQRVDTERLRFYLRLLQTTSPSYVIMASLDMTRAIMQYHGKTLMDRLLGMVNSFVQDISANENLPFRVFSAKRPEHGCTDITRIVINVEKTGCSGYEIEKILRLNNNIQVEMSDLYNIVCIAAVADRQEFYDRLYDSLCSIADRFKYTGTLADKRINILNIPRKEVSLKEAVNKKVVKLRLEDAVGRVSSATVTPYPPGIPVVCPGEILLQETVEYIYNIINRGGIVNGLGENHEINVV
ncbi:MAG: aminotransferase class I/II-fold pyridoxal phosphate-dependent enzyme [Clostridia bacterium]|nr:aminotransferase class I/II-fold pyridoxal phosphate-dependent enzyme [Clostridia bacterium]